jgi:uncharacterized alpha-E superfamily protein
MLLSRLAEHIYWAGRYLERAEATARLVKVSTEIYLDLPRSVSVGWRPMLAVTGATGTYDAIVADEAEGVVATEEQRIVGFLTTDEHNPGSVLSCLTAARTNLRSVRALLPRSAWEIANSLHLWGHEHADLAVPRRSRIEWLESIIRQCQTLAGAIDHVMSHDQAYAFLQIGRQLERADMTTRVIDVQAAILLDHRVGDGTLPYADITWMGVLRSVSASQMFRRVAAAGVHGPRALEFLLCDPQFPRSVEHCLTELGRHLIELPRHDDAMKACAAAQEVLDDAVFAGVDGPELHAFIDRLQGCLAAIHDAAATTWFAPSPAVPAGQSQSQGAPSHGAQSHNAPASVR